MVEPFFFCWITRASNSHRWFRKVCATGHPRIVEEVGKSEGPVLKHWNKLKKYNFQIANEGNQHGYRFFVKVNDNDFVLRIFSWGFSVRKFIKELDMRRFLATDGNRKCVVFPFNLSSHYHIDRIHKWRLFYFCSVVVQIIAYQASPESKNSFQFGTWQRGLVG